MTDQARSTLLTPVVRKVFLAVLFGGLTYVVTELKNQPEIWQLLMTAFISGVTLVIQYLSDFDSTVKGFAKQLALTEQVMADRAASMGQVVGAGFQKINSATELFGLVEQSALQTEGVIQLVRNATRVQESPPLVFEFAEAEIVRVSKFLEELHNGDASYYGEDRDWLLTLTGTVHNRIDATSSMTVDAGGVDFDGGFWMNDLGRHYLIKQEEAIRRRNVRVRRIFLLQRPDLTQNDTFRRVHRDQKDAGIDVRVLTPDLVPSIIRNDLVDFILFDDVISYEVTPATPVDPNPKPMIAKTTLELRPASVERKVEMFQVLWEAAKELPD